LLWVSAGVEMTIDAHFTIGNNKGQLFARVNAA